MQEGEINKSDKVPTLLGLTVLEGRGNSHNRQMYLDEAKCAVYRRQRGRVLRGLTQELTFKLRPEKGDYLKGGGQSDLWSTTACAKALGWERGCQRDKGRALGQTA